MFSPCFGLIKFFVFLCFLLSARHFCFLTLLIDINFAACDDDPRSESKKA